MNTTLIKTNYGVNINILNRVMRCRGRGRNYMVVGFTTTCTISAEMNSIQHYVISLSVT